MFFNFLSEWVIDANWFTNWFYSPEFIFGIVKYAVCILSGIILAYFICTKEGERMGINKDDVLVCATIIVPLCILGARLWYFLSDSGHKTNYYEYYGFFKATAKSFLDFIGYTVDASGHARIELAGLAIHGGITVAAIMIVVCSKWKKWKITRVADMVAPGFFIGQICGRWGNFFNQEAYGTVIGGWSEEGNLLVPKLTGVEQWERMTKVFHIPKFIARNMWIYDGTGYYNSKGEFAEIENQALEGMDYIGNFFHPTFLYESCLNLIGLLVYFILRRQKWVRSGFFAGFYLIWYGIVRFIIEIVRTDSLYLSGTNIKMAQLTSVIMIVIGIAILLYIYLIKKTDKYTDIIKENETKKEEVKEEVVEVVNITK